MLYVCSSTRFLDQFCCLQMVGHAQILKLRFCALTCSRLYGLVYWRMVSIIGQHVAIMGHMVTITRHGMFQLVRLHCSVGCCTSVRRQCCNKPFVVQYSTVLLFWALSCGTYLWGLPVSGLLKGSAGLSRPAAGQGCVLCCAAFFKHVCMSLVCL